MLYEWKLISFKNLISVGGTKIFISAHSYASGKARSNKNKIKFRRLIKKNNKLKL